MHYIKYYLLYIKFAVVRLFKISADIRYRTIWVSRYGSYLAMPSGTYVIESKTHRKGNRMWRQFIKTSRIELYVC